MSQVPGSVRVATESVGGRACVVVRIEATARRGALSAADGDKMTRAVELALDKRLPLVVFTASSGADANDGVAALDGWGRAARALVRASGVVPALVVVDGPAVSGSALLVGLADLAVFTAGSYAFVSGPIPVRTMTGVKISAPELGGAPVHGTSSGVAAAVVDDVEEATELVAEYLAYLPDHHGALPPRIDTFDPVDRDTIAAGEVLPAVSTGSYDVRDVIAEIVDDGVVSEVRAGWAPNMVTAFASIGGRPVGVVANQPLAIAGTLDIVASQKGARFVAMCDAFGLPLVTFVDTPGFYPGKDLEWRGMIRKGAQLAFAYARATVPRVALVLRKSYGGAYIVMDSKTMGNDVFLAWPSAEIAVMGAEQAAEILHRRATPEERAERVVEYEERYLNPYVAAERGLIDAVVEPADTRRRLAAALEMVSTKRERLPRRLHDNTPL